MKISAVVAVWNGEAFLEQQVESIFAQTVAPGEVILQDDGSTDGTVPLMAELQRRYGGRLTVTRNPGRKGCDGNFESLLRRASGDVIFLADQDDVWHPERIAKMLAPFQKEAGPVGVFCNSRCVDSGLHPLGWSHWESRGFGKDAAQFREQPGLWLRRVPMAGHDVALDRRLLEKLLPFPALPDCYDSWIGLALAAEGRWRCVAEELTDFRRHDAALSGSGGRPGLRRQWNEARKALQTDAAGWTAQLYREVLRRYAGTMPAAVEAALRDRMRHSEARSRMNVPLRQRLPLIWHEWQSGRYARYGRGWKNAVQDLLLRRPA